MPVLVNLGLESSIESEDEIVHISKKQRLSITDHVAQEDCNLVEVTKLLHTL